MKKLLGIILFMLCTLNVYAANYELKELIPIEKETTIVTNNFSYRSFSYDEEGYINFKSIKNLTTEELPISISIALFDENKKNIGTILYCSNENKLGAKEDKSFSIPVTKDYLGPNITIKDVHYIAVLDDNKSCKTGGSDYYLGQSVEEIGQPKNTTLTTPTVLFLKVLAVVGGIILFLFIYRFLFTTSYENMDGSGVRIGYKKYNKQLKEDRERELREHPPQPKEVKQTKTDKVLQQEEDAANEDQTGTELHNFYK